MKECDKIQMYYLLLVFNSQNIEHDKNYGAKIYFCGWQIDLLVSYPFDREMLTYTIISKIITKLTILNLTVKFLSLDLALKLYHCA